MYIELVNIYVFWILIQYLCVYVFAWIFSVLAIWNSIKCLFENDSLALMSLWYIQIFTGYFLFFSTQLLSETIPSSPLIFYFAWPSPRISHFSKEPWFLWLRNGIRNQELGARCAHCCSGIIAPMFSRLIE